MKATKNLFLLAAALWITGCVNTSTAYKSPDADLLSLKSIYVKQNQEDNRGIGRLIADKLKTKGVQSTVGVGDPPGNVDALVSYKDVWAWDLTSYLLDLTILIKNSKNEQVVATGNSRHGSLTRLTPTEMVSEVIDNIYSHTSGGTTSASISAALEPKSDQDQAQQTNAQKLQKIRSLLDQGVITKPEYDQKKQSILNQM